MKRQEQKLNLIGKSGAIYQTQEMSEKFYNDCVNRSARSQSS